MADTTIWTTSFDEATLEVPDNPRGSNRSAVVQFKEDTSVTRVLISCENMSKIAGEWLLALEAYDHEQAETAVSVDA